MSRAVAQAPDRAEDSPMEMFRAQLEKRLASFEEALPPQITIGQFKAVIMRAVMADPALLGADRVSLFESALASASDGLLPDKREGAFVIYNAKVREGKKGEGKETWIKKVQWMPMIRGVFTKLYQTGQVRAAKVAVVYGGDHFRAWTDDAGDHIEYEEAERQDRSIVRTVFAHVVMKDGGVFVETMKPDEVEKIRAASKAKDSGPWVDWWEEMAKKSVFRRLAKRLPMSRTIMPVLERDNVLYDLEAQRAIAPRAAPRSLISSLDSLADRPMPMATGGEREKEPVGREDRRQDRDEKSTSPRKHATNDRNADVDRSAPDRDGVDGKAADQPARKGGGSAAENGDDAEAYRAGRKAYLDGRDRGEIPADYRDDGKFEDAFLEGYDAAAAEQQ